MGQVHGEVLSSRAHSRGTHFNHASGLLERELVIPKQGSECSDLIELRLTWREMENFIFLLMRTFGEISSL